MPDTETLKPSTAKNWPRQSEVESFYGKIECGNDGQPTDRWESANLTHLNLPYPFRLSWETEKVVRKLTCHRSVARDLGQILSEILEHYRKLGGSDCEGKRLLVEDGMDLYGGCYCFRRMRGGASLSMHSYGIAIDLDPERNELGKPWKANSGMMPEAVVAIFEHHGWTWGGHWKKADAMHFQAARV